MLLAEAVVVTHPWDGFYLLVLLDNVKEIASAVVSSYHHKIKKNNGVVYL